MTLSHSITFNHESVILDASCLINLSASGQLRSIIAALPINVAVTHYVHVDEVLWEYAGPDDNVAQTKQPINLQPLIDQGYLQVVDTESEAEALMLVNYAALMDDGEAITAAIAAHRNWAVAVDDRKARRVIAEHSPHIQILSTLDLVRYWAEILPCTQVELAQVLQQIRVRGKYIPHANHPQFDWWRAHFPAP